MNEQREKVELSEGRRVLRGLLIMLPAMLVIPLLMDLIAEAVIPGRRMGFDYHSGPGIFIVIGYPLMLVWMVKPRKIIRFWLSLVGPLLVFYIGGIALVCAVRGYSMDWGKIALEVGVFTPVAHVVGIGWIWDMGDGSAGINGSVERINECRTEKCRISKGGFGLTIFY